MSRKEQLRRILFALDRHFDGEGISADVDCDRRGAQHAAIAAEILDFMEKHGALSIIMSDGIIGYPDQHRPNLAYSTGTNAIEGTAISAAV